MPAKVYQYTCPDCGIVFDSPHRRNGSLCPSCGLTRMNAAAQQMHDKSGPYYDTWLAARKRREEAV